MRDSTWHHTVVFSFHHQLFSADNDDLLCELT
jgi:hypothetical protein